MSIKYTTTYEQGALVPAVSCQVKSLGELIEYLEESFTSLGIQKKRVKIPYELVSDQALNILQDHGYFPVYYHYSLNISDYVGEPDPDIKFDDNLDILSFADIVRPLMHECAERMPCEFDEKGEDPSWFFLGKQMFYIPDTITQEIAGCRFVEKVAPDTMKMWMAYVSPQHRRKGIYTRLLDHIKWYAKAQGVTYLSVATDVTKHNPMHGILESHGFSVSTATYRN